MVLVDTSIWINHLRSRDPHLKKLLFNGEVSCHLHIIGELACGNINNRQEILTLLQELPRAPLVEFDEFLFFVDQNKLHGRGIGLVDIHLLASAKLGQLSLWTGDKRLQAASADLGIKYTKRR